MSEVIEVRGVNGQIRFDGRSVTITREGALARLSQGRSEKTVPLSQIAAVQFKPPALMTRGFIQLTIPGDTSTRAQKGSRTVDAAGDENAVLISKKDVEQSRTLVRAINDALAAR